MKDDAGVQAAVRAGKKQAYLAARCRLRSFCEVSATLHPRVLSQRHHPVLPVPVRRSMPTTTNDRRTMPPVSCPRMTNPRRHLWEDSRDLQLRRGYLVRSAVTVVLLTGRDSLIQK